MGAIDPEVANKFALKATHQEKSAADLKEEKRKFLLAKKSKGHENSSDWLSAGSTHSETKDGGDSDSDEFRFEDLSLSRTGRPSIAAQSARVRNLIEWGDQENSAEEIQTVKERQVTGKVTGQVTGQVSSQQVPSAPSNTELNFLLEERNIAVDILVEEKSKLQTENAQLVAKLREMEIRLIDAEKFPGSQAVNQSVSPSASAACLSFAAEREAAVVSALEAANLEICTLHQEAEHQSKLRDTAIASLQQALEDSRKDHKVQIDEISSANRSAHELIEKMHSEFEIEKAETLQRLSSFAAERANLEQQLELVRARNAELQILEADLSQQRRVEDLVNEVTDLQGQLNRSNVERATVKKSIAVLQEQNHHLNAEISKMHSEFSVLKTETLAVSEERSKLISEVNWLKAESISLQEIAEASRERERSGKDDLLELNEQRQEEIFILQDTLKTERSESAKTHMRVDTLQSEMASMRLEMSTLHALLEASEERELKARENFQVLADSETKALAALKGLLISLGVEPSSRPTADELTAQVGQLVTNLQSEIRTVLRDKQRVESALSRALTKLNQRPILAQLLDSVVECRWIGESENSLLLPNSA